MSSLSILEGNAQRSIDAPSAPQSGSAINIPIPSITNSITQENLSNTASKVDESMPEPVKIPAVQSLSSQELSASNKLTTTMLLSPNDADSANTAASISNATTLTKTTTTVRGKTKKGTKKKKKTTRLYSTKTYRNKSSTASKPTASKPTTSKPTKSKPTASKTTASKTTTSAAGKRVRKSSLKKQKSPKSSTKPSTSKSSPVDSNRNNVVGSVGSQAAKAQALKLRGGDNARLSHSVLTKTNFLIQTAEVRAEPITSLRELEQCAASMFVAIFESMFRVRLRGIVREPQRLQDYAQNAQLVIDAISSAFHVDIRHINGNLICDGHRASISTLVDVFIEILTEKVSSRRGRSRSCSEERQQFRETRSPASGESRTEGLVDMVAARRRRPTSAPPTERRTTSRDSPSSQDLESSKRSDEKSRDDDVPNQRRRRRRRVLKKKAESNSTKMKKKKSSFKNKSKSKNKAETLVEKQHHGGQQSASKDWLEEDASQLVMDDSSSVIPINNRQNVSSQYLAAAAMAAAAAALEAPHDLNDQREDDEVEFNTNVVTRIEDEEYDKDSHVSTSEVATGVTAAESEKESENSDMEQSPLWEAQEHNAILVNEHKVNLDDDDLNRVLDRIASLDTSSVAGSAIAKPLWDMLIRAGSSSDKSSSSFRWKKGKDNTNSTTKRQIRQAEIRNRHRMYKKLLKAQIKALKIEENEEGNRAMSSLSSSLSAPLKSNVKSRRADVSFDSFSSSPIRGKSPGRTFALRSNSEAHQARVELIRETRLKKELRRAAKAKLIRRKRREELVVDKLFTAALKDERRRLAIERAETRRAQKIEEQSRQEKTNTRQHQYTEHRKMLAEQVRQQEDERKIARRAQKFEFKSMARELRDEKRKRFQQLIEQLDRQGQEDQNSDFVSGLGADLEGPGMSGKLRALLKKITTAPEPKAERLSWMRTRTDRPILSPTKRLNKRKARQKKERLLKNVYGSAGQQ